MAADLRETFRDPPPEYRGAPFWAWNGKLDPDELRRQVRDMKAHGMGGFFMHSRSGLETPYLSREWMGCIKATVDEAKKVGMQAWLYDEDKWPSGAAGGLVTALHPEYRAKGLLLRRLSREEYMPDAHSMWAFTARADGEVLSSVKPLAPDARSIPKGTEAFLFSVVTERDSGWHNGGAYLDTLDPEAVRKFLDVTLDPHVREVGKEFGGVVPGIFTDEPKYGGSPGIAWTARLPDVFGERYGYDVTARLPELFFDVKGVESHRVRRDYFDCITHMFAEAFSRQYGERCEELGFALSGHYLAEQTLALQTRVIGAAMRHYEHMQLPGIDILRESIDEVLTVKQCSSVARQLGKERVLSELYGASGWDFSFEAEKWVGDWQIALGVNLRCQHLAWYTMARAGKRDFPPCFSYQSSSWKYHKPIEDYFARLCYVTTLGDAEREVLVLHPIESFWATRAARVKPRGDLDKNLRTVMAALLESHHDFDLGDEDILARHAGVEAHSLRVGKALYRAIVVPPAVTWRRSTVDILERFADAGGKVIVVEPAATRVDCQVDKRLAALGARKDVRVAECDREPIREALDSARVRTVSVAAPDGGEIAPVLTQRRSFEGRTILFLANTDRERGCTANVAVAGTTGGVEDWDLRTGRVQPLPSRAGGGWVRTRIELPPVGSKLLVFGPDCEAGVGAWARHASPAKDVGKVRLRRTWRHARADLNARILDRCSYRVDDEPLSNATAVWIAERDIRARLGLPPNGCGDVQPWKRNEHIVETGRTVELRFGFKARVRPTKALWLVMEHPQDFEIELNGTKVTSKPKGWWIDREFAKIDLKGKVKKGANEIVVRARMRTDTALEQMYLAGDFGVDAKSLDLVTEPKELKTGDWVKQGYAQYTGSMFLSQDVRIVRGEGQRLFLVFATGALAATCAAVKVNAKAARLVPWPPYEIEVTDLARNGKNTIEIEVVTSRRNLLGPLHLEEATPAWVGPAEIAPDRGRCLDGYTFAPAGIVGNVTIVRRKEA